MRREGRKEGERCLLQFNCAGYCTECVAEATDIADNSGELFRTRGSNYTSLGI